MGEVFQGIKLSSEDKRMGNFITSFYRYLLFPLSTLHIELYLLLNVFPGPLFYSTGWYCVIDSYKSG